MSDWLFDRSATEETLNRLAREAADAITEARSALEGCDLDAPSPADRLRMLSALERVSRTRNRLRALNAELIGDAERMLEDALSIERRPGLALASGDA